MWMMWTRIAKTPARLARRSIMSRSTNPTAFASTERGTRRATDGGSPRRSVLHRGNKHDKQIADSFAYDGSPFAGSRQSHVYRDHRADSLPKLRDLPSIRRGRSVRLDHL